MMAISVDSTAVHKMWDENELSRMVDGGIPFHLVSDGGGKLGKMYGIYDEDAGVDIRGKFLIDPDGVIQAMEVLSPPVGRNVNEALRQIRAYQHVRQTGAKEVCPAGWEPGKTTLKPSPALVGNVWKEWK